MNQSKADLEESKNFVNNLTEFEKINLSVLRIGNSLYSRVGKNEQDIISGYEYYITHDDSQYIRVQAIKEIINIIERRIKNKHL